ncbi:hypothetical protein FMEXI_10242 [Fusarium mexicanum]|uniref:Metallo-beta-lactamase domain-containing protein n=1 Tax=Fusarium mexicanum TaxID=751941 RepID=A0A8H5IGP7_9HYPO|nr:hypothetical protein FMEXI_10242 [Fusarium mexicanum]
MDSPKLHVVYSGRGDAMFIEHTVADSQGQPQRRLIIIDGGPRSYKTGEAPGGETDPAPYPKYFIAAAKRIWRDMGRNGAFSPDTIIATHAHEDHIGGLLTLIKSSQENPGTMVFKGPLIFPRFKIKRKEAHIARIWELLVTQGIFFPIEDQDRIAPVVLPTLSNEFELVYPVGGELVQLISGPPLPAPWNDRNAQEIANAKKVFLKTAFEEIDEGKGDSLNRTSMIVKTRFPSPDDITAAQQAIFTADQNAANIAKSMAWIDANFKPMNQHPNLPHYSVYKIQHHGSGYDSALWETSTVPKDILIETAIFGILEWRLRPDDRVLHFTHGAQIEIESCVLQLLSDWILTALLQMMTADEIRGKLLDVLGERHDAFLNQLYAPTGTILVLPHPDIVAQVIDNVWRPAVIEQVKAVRPVKNYPVDWYFFWHSEERSEERKKTGFKFHPAGTRSRSQGKIPSTTLDEAVSKWIGGEADGKDLKKTIWNDYWGGHARCTASRDFFSLFTADAYVVSANKDHHHPSPSTLLGLSWAVHLQQRQACLYVTSPNGLQMAEINYYAKNLQRNQGIRFERLFHHVSQPMGQTQITGAIKILCLSQRVYMTLDMTPGHMNNRTVQGVEEIDLSRMFLVHRRHDLWEENKKYLPKPALADAWRRIRCSVEHVGEYVLNIDANGIPTVSPLDQTNVIYDTLLVQEAWEVDNLAFGWVRLTSPINGAVANVKFEQGPNNFSKKKTWYCLWKTIEDNDFRCFCIDQDRKITPETFEGNDKLVKLRFLVEPADDPTPILQGQLFGVNFMAAMPNMTMFSNSSSMLASVVNMSQQRTISRSIANTRSVGSKQDQEKGPMVQTVNTMVSEVVIEPKKLREFLDFSSISVPVAEDGNQALVNAETALKWVVTEDNFKGLGFSLAYQLRAFSYHVDLERSSVSFVDNHLGTEVYKAQLVMAIPENEEINIGSDKVKITMAHLSLEWSVDRTLVAVMLLMTEDDQLLAGRKVLEKAVGRAPSLFKILTTMGHTTDMLEKITLFQLFCVILQSETKVHRIFAEQTPVALLDAGFPKILPDMVASTAKATYDTSGRIVLESVKIVCKLDEASGWSGAFSAGPFSIELRTLNVQIDNPRLSSEQILLEGEAVIKVGDSAGLTVAMKVDFGTESGPEIKFSISGGSSFESITSIMTQKPDISKLEVPFSSSTSEGKRPLLNDSASGKTSSTTASPKLMNLSEIKKTTVGITLQQPVSSLGYYRVRNLFAVVNLAAWMDYIPDIFPKQEVDPTVVHLQVLDPFSSSSRAVAVQINSRLRLKLAKRTEVLAFQLSANPLATEGEYDYRVRVMALGQGCSVWDVIEKLGLEFRKPELGDQVPLLKNTLDAVRLKSVSMSIVSNPDGKLKFGDWSLHLHIPWVAILPKDAVQLVSVDAFLSKEYGLLSATLTGHIYLREADKLVKAFIQTPEEGVADIFTSFSLPSIKDIPLVRDVLKIELETAYFMVDYSGSYLTVLYARCTFTYPSFKLGTVDFNDVNFSITYESADPDTSDSTAEIQFGAGCSLAERSLGVRVLYDSATKRLTASLKPLKRVSIAVVVDTMLPEDVREYNVLHSILGDLMLNDAEIEFGTGDGHHLKHLLIDVSNDSPLNMERFNLTNLKVEYRRVIDSLSEVEHKSDKSVGVASEKPSLPTDVKTGSGSTDVSKRQDDEPDDKYRTSLQIVAGLKKGETHVNIQIDCLGREDGSVASISIEPVVKDSLRMARVLSLFDFERKDLQLSVPTDCTDCFDVSIQLIQGTVAVVRSSNVADKNSLQFRTFELSAHSTEPFTILDEPVKLQVLRMSLHVKYNAVAIGEDPQGLSGMLSGVFMIGDVPLLVTYSKHESYGHAFTGQMMELSQRTRLSDLAQSVGISEKNYRVPSDQSSSWTLSSVNGLFLPKKLVEVRATLVDPSGPVALSRSIGGLDLVLEALQVAFRVDYRTKEELSDPKAGQPPNRVAGERKSTSRTDESKFPCEIWLHGKLRVKTLVAMEAWLWIRSPGETILSAVLTKDKRPQPLSEMCDIVSSSNKDLLPWTDVVPPTFKPLTLGETGVTFWANFTKSKLLMMGQIDENVSAIFMVKALGDETKSGNEKDPSKPAGEKKRGYVAALLVRDLAALWEPLQSTITDRFPIINAAAYAQGHECTVKDIREDLNMEKDPQLQSGTLPDDIQKALTGLDDKTKIEPGFWVFATIDVYSSDTSKSMKDVIALDLAPKTDLPQDAPATIITLYAKMAMTKSQETIYQVSVKDLFFCGPELRINGAGTYRPKAVDPEPNFDLKARLDVALEFDNSQKILQFDVDFQSSKSITRFDAAGKVTDKVIDNPLSGMFNVQIYNFGISGSSRKLLDGTIQRDWKVFGQAKFKGSPPKTMSSISGEILFVNGSPSVVVLKYQTGTMDMSELFDSVVKPNPPPVLETQLPASWPNDDFDPIEFKSLIFTYAKGQDGKDSVIVQGLEYQTGFNFTADLTLFGKDFAVSALIPQSRSGVRLKGTYRGTIDVRFAQVHNPSVGLDTTSTNPSSISFVANADFTFFGIDGFSLDLQYQPSTKVQDRVFKGTATYDKPLLGMKKGDVRLTVAYSKGQWGFEGWDMSLVNDAVNILDAIEKGSHNDGLCEALVDFAAKLISKEVKTQFHFTLGLPRNQQPSHEIPQISGKKSVFKFTLSVSFNVIFAGKIVTTVSLDKSKPMEFGVPFEGKFTISNLVEVIWATITSPENWEQIGAAILREPAKFGAILTVVGIEGFGKELIKRIVCRNTQPENIKLRARQDFLEDIADALKKIKEVAEAAKDWAVSVGAAVAAAAAIAEFLEGVGAGILAGLLGAFGVTIGYLINKALDQAEKDWVDEQMKIVEGELRNLSDLLNKIEEALREALVMEGLVKADYLDDKEESVIKATWSKPGKGNFSFEDSSKLSYEVRISTENVIPQDGETTVMLELTRQNDEYRYVGKVFVWVQAILKDHGREYSSRDWTQVQPPHVKWLRPPTGIDLRVQGDSCVVEIPVSDVEPADYFLELRAKSFSEDSPGELVFARPFSGVDDGPHEILIPITALSAMVTKASLLDGFIKQISWDPNNAHDSPFGISTQSLNMLPAPTGLSVQLEKRSVRVTWDETYVSLPTSGYTVSYTKEDGTTLVSLTQDSKAGQYSVTTKLESAKNGDNIDIAVRANSSPNMLYLTAKKTWTLSYQPQLTITNANYDEEDGWLSIEVASDILLPLDCFFVIRSTSQSQNILSVPDPIKPRCIWGKMATLRVVDKMIKLPIEIQASIAAPSSGDGDPTAPYTIQALSEDISRLKLGATKLEAIMPGEWRVTWEGSSSQGKMTMCVEDPNTRHILVKRTVLASDKGITIKAQECKA